MTAGGDMIETTQEAGRFGLIVLLGLDAIALVLSLTRQGTPSPYAVGNFFSYFTVQSNLMAIVLVAAMLGARDVWSRWPLFRGAVTSYLAMTAVVYECLLAANPLDLMSNLPDTVLHLVAPIALMIAWILEPPRRQTRCVSALWWLAFPLAYVAYTLIRGAVVHWYPYAFLNPALNGGYFRIAGWVAVLTLVAGAIVLAVNWLARVRVTRVTASKQRRERQE